jgi:hypothetical protein
VRDGRPPFSGRTDLVMSFLNAEVMWATGAGMPQWCIPVDSQVDQLDRVDLVDPPGAPGLGRLGMNPGWCSGTARRC